MKVLQLMDLDGRRPGGLELSVRALCAELTERGHEVELTTLADLRGWSRALKRFYEDPLRPFHPTVPDPGVVRELRRLIARARPDVVHAHGWIAYSALAAASSDGPPVVVGVHDYGHVCAKKTMLRGDDSICGGPALRACLSCASAHYGAAKAGALTLGLRVASPLHRRAAVFVANSNAVAEATRARLPSRARVEVIAPTPPGDALSAGSPRPRFLPDRDGYVLFVGAFGGHKGLSVLLDAFRDPGLHAPLVVIGAGDPPAGIPANVTVARDVAHDQVLAAWRHSALGVVPSTWAEPFGLVAVEAMAAGRPVVASALGGLNDIVADGETGLLVPPGDARALAAAVNHLLDGPDRRRAMGEAARFRAARFSRAATVDQVESLYFEIASRARRPAYAAPVTAPDTKQRAAAPTRPRNVYDPIAGTSTPHR
jgi:glycosyltransferase involved in cell wall biosynthesis